MRRIRRLVSDARGEGSSVDGAIDASYGEFVARLSRIGRGPRSTKLRGRSR